VLATLFAQCKDMASCHDTMRIKARYRAIDLSLVALTLTLVMRGRRVTMTSTAGKLPERGKVMLSSG
jgi:hypothetical protein